MAFNNNNTHYHMANMVIFVLLNSLLGNLETLILH